MRILVCRNIIVSLFFVKNLMYGMWVILCGDGKKSLNLGNWDTPNTIIAVEVRYNVNVAPIPTLITHNKAGVGMNELIGEVEWLFRLSHFIVEIVKLVYAMVVQVCYMFSARGT